MRRGKYLLHFQLPEPCLEPVRDGQSSKCRVEDCDMKALPIQWVYCCLSKACAIPFHEEIFMLQYCEPLHLFKSQIQKKKIISSELWCPKIVSPRETIWTSTPPSHLFQISQSTIAKEPRYANRFCDLPI